MTSEDIQRYTRIVLYWLMGALASHGVAVGTYTELVVSGGVTLATFLWSAYSTRLIAKLNEIAKYDEVKAVLVQPTAVAENPNLVTATDPKVATTVTAATQGGSSV